MVRHDCILLIAAPQASPPASRLATLATLTTMLTIARAAAPRFLVGASAAKSR
jgi:hypothetical protein